MTEKRTLAQQLRDMAAVSSDVNPFKLEVHGRSFEVFHASGSSNLLALFTTFPAPKGGRGGAPRASGSPHRADSKRRIEAERPLLLKLRRETKGDVRGKEMRINREVELGDPAFDKAIYIDTPSEPRVVKAILEGSEVRAAALELLDKDVSAIEIDDEAGLIKLTVREFQKLEADRTRVHRILDAFARLVDALPEVIALPAARGPDRFGRALVAGGTLAFLGFLGVLLSYAALSPRSCIVRSIISDDSSFRCSVSPDCCSPAFLGLGVGAMASGIFAGIFFVTIRGKSSSYRRMIAAVIITSLLCLELGVFITRLAW